jgi:hypothetical protein
MSGTTQSPAQTAVTECYQALFRVSQSLISIRSSEELFSILARELRAVVNYYFLDHRPSTANQSRRNSRGNSHLGAGGHGPAHGEPRHTNASDFSLASKEYCWTLVRNGSAEG